MFLDFAEDQARRRKQIFLANWQSRLDDFLKLNQRAILPDAGKVSRERADLIAEEEYERFSDARRTRIENQAETDRLAQLEDELKQMPEARKRERPQE